MKKQIVLLVLVLLPLGALAQDPMTGYPPYGSFQVDRFDGINRQNLNVNFAIPIVSVPGRGQNFSFSIVYDSLIWIKNGKAWSPVINFGWKREAPTGTITYVTQTYNCASGGTAQRYSSYAFTDVAGTRHNFSVNFYDVPTSCNYATDPRKGNATDGSGIYLDATDPTQPKVTIPSGTIFSGGELTDPNGNYFTVSIQGSFTNWTDTQGRVVLKIENVSPTTINYHVLDQTGGYQVTTMTLLSYNIKTKFSCTGVNEYTGSAYLPTTIALPNGQSYSMTYEDTPGFAGYKTGRVKHVALPTGGYYEYQYPTGGQSSNGGVNCTDGTGKSLTRIINDGTTSATWTYTRAQSGSNWDTTVTAPMLPYDIAGNRSMFTYDSSGRLTTQKFYQGSSTLLRTVNTTWDTVQNTPTSTTLVLENGVQANTETEFDAYGNLTRLKEYDWGSPGTLVRETAISYLSDSNYTIVRNIRDRVAQVLVKDGSGVVKLQTDINYDEPAYSNQNCPPGALQHNDTAYGCSFTFRGNPTTVTTYATPATQGGAVSRHFYYDWFGNVIKADVNCCQQKQWIFSSATQYAYPDSLIDGPAGGPQLTTTFTYNSYTGLLTSTTDPNQKTSYFAYDNLGRPTTVTRPDSQQITTAYNDAARTVTVDAPIQGTNRAQQETSFDGLGRSFKQCLLDGGGANVSCTETQFDKVGQPYKASNPYTVSAQYWTETRFDGLGRPTMTIPPDGTATTNRTTFSYAGNAATISDPASKVRRSKTDGLGRLAEVDEPGEEGASNPPTAGTGSVAVSGTEQSISGTPATAGTGSVTISGDLQSFQVNICEPGMPIGPWCYETTYDAGTVWITVNGLTKTVSYGQGSTADSIADALRTDINNDATYPVTASGIGTTVGLTAKTTGSSTNYSLSAGSTYDSATFAQPSFTATPSGSTLTGGSNGTSTVYDSGTVWISVNGSQKTVSYGQGSTSGSIASALRTAINNDSLYPVTAAGSGSTVTLTAKTTGASTNYSLAAGTTYNSSSFSHASFTPTPSGATLTGGSDGNDPFSTGYSTTYSYNVLDQLTQVSQGLQTRTYNYDGMGRLISVTTPEAGTVSYVYNSFNLVTQRTDARTIITSYSYDALNRLTGVSYSDTTPAVTFAYGTSAASNNNGRLTSMSDGTGSESYAYDILGRITTVTKVIDGVSYPMGYAYNLAGELASVTYPSGRVVQQSYDPVGRLSQIVSGAVTYASGFAYNPAGQVTGFNYGNGVVASFGYSAERLALATLRYSKGATDLLNLSYGYTQNGGNNGQITSITDSTGTQEAGRSVTYTYDELARLKTAQTTGSASYPQWGMNWTYDRYGNRTVQTVTAGFAPMNSLTVSATTNRITSGGATYDDSGNMTNDGQYAYTYDAENRAKMGAGATYSYDGAGLRVKKVAGATTTRYISSGVKVIAEYVNGAAVGSPTREYIYSGSALLATIEGATTTYHHQDHLSVRVNTDTSGNVVGQQGNYPFGEAWYTTSTTTKWRFTSYERDAESGNDYAIFRYHSNRLGRFLTPDVLAGTVLNPQSLNRYAYVLNGPVNLIDPLGLRERPTAVVHPLDGPMNCTLDQMAISCGLFDAISAADGIDYQPLGPGWSPDPSEPTCLRQQIGEDRFQTWCPGDGSNPLPNRGLDSGGEGSGEDEGGAGLDFGPGDGVPSAGANPQRLQWPINQYQKCVRDSELLLAAQSQVSAAHGFGAALSFAAGVGAGAYGLATGNPLAIGAGVGLLGLAIYEVREAGKAADWARQTHENRIRKCAEMYGGR